MPPRLLAKLKARSALAAAVLLAALLLAIEAGGCRDDGSGVATPKAGVSPSATAGPSPSASPTPTAPDLAAAAALARDGRYDEAIAAYRAVIEGGDAATGAAARLALARLLVQEERYEEAGQELEAALREGPSPEAALREGPSPEAALPARFLLAEVRAALGEGEEALELYGAYIAGGGRASAYARMERAVLLAGLGRTQEAESEAEAALASGLPAGARLPFVLRLAQAHEGAGALVAARGRYRQLLLESSSSADKALALSRLAAIRRAEGDPLWSEDAAAAVAGYPATAGALAALEELMAAGVPVGGFEAGLVYYRSRRPEEARAAFERELAEGPGGVRAAGATYYLAALAEEAGDVEGALRGYARAQALAPAGELADDALWWRGRLLEGEGRLGEAEEAYGALVAGYPASSWAAGAAFRLGLVRYKAGRYGEAAEAWRAAAVAASAGEAARLLLWEGKSLLAAGSEGAVAAWRAAAAVDPYGYYGLRAAAFASGEGEGETLEEGLEVPAETEEERRSTEAWLAASVGQGSPTAGEGVLLDERWAVGEELLALGRRRQASAEYSALIERAAGDAAALYELARAFRAAGLSDLSARAGARVLAQVPPAAPAAVLRLAYPVDYADVLLEAADGQDVPPLLLLALVRQESFFDPLARSGSGALGLTQVIPSTAEGIAAKLGTEGFEVDDLFRPAVSLRFGASYLADQLDAFGGNLYYALAAYNGGPSNARRWREAGGGDPDLFLEEIDREETHLYVRRVMEHLARYRQLYGGAAGPALPAATVERD